MTLAPLIFEIFSEEMPVWAQEQAQKNFFSALQQACDERQLSFTGIRVLTTPRRIVCLIEGLPLQTAALAQEIKGPSIHAPQEALSGFLNKYHIPNLDSCTIMTDAKGKQYYVFTHDTTPQDTRTILSDLIRDAILSQKWKTTMRWVEGQSFEWVRPIHSLSTLFDGQTLSHDHPVIPVPIQYASEIQGHEFLSKPFPMDTDYLKNLAQRFVIADHEQRTTLIRARLHAFMEEHHLTTDLSVQEDWIRTVSATTEWPGVLFGSFDPTTIDPRIPHELYALVMLKHQFYLPFYNKDGQTLSGRFAIISPLPTVDNFTSEFDLLFKQTVNLSIQDCIITEEQKEAILSTENERLQDFTSVLESRFHDMIFLFKKDLPIFSFFIGNARTRGSITCGDTGTMHYRTDTMGICDAKNPSDKDIENMLSQLFHEEPFPITKDNYSKEVHEHFITEDLQPLNWDKKKVTYSHITSSLYKTLANKDMIKKVIQMLWMTLYLRDNLKLGDSFHLLIRAILLCKLDLETETVKEFPEVHGIMTTAFLRAMNPNLLPEIGDAIAEHLLPTGKDSNLPTTLIGNLLSLIDKMDRLISVWMSNPSSHPTSSGDPYALRRTVLGIFRILDQDFIPDSITLVSLLNAKFAINPKLNKIITETSPPPTPSQTGTDLLTNVVSKTLLEKIETDLLRNIFPAQILQIIHDKNTQDHTVPNAFNKIKEAIFSFFAKCFVGYVKNSIDPEASSFIFSHDPVLPSSEDDFEAPLCTLLQPFKKSADELQQALAFSKAIERIQTTLTSSTYKAIENHHSDQYHLLSEDVKKNQLNQELQRLHDQYPVLLYAREHLVSDQRSEDGDVSFAKHCGENLERLIEDIQRFMDQEYLAEEDVALFWARSAPLERIMNPLVFEHARPFRRIKQTRPFRRIKQTLAFLKAIKRIQTTLTSSTYKAIENRHHELLDSDLPQHEDFFSDPPRPEDFLQWQISNETDRLYKKYPILFNHQKCFNYSEYFKHYIRKNISFTVEEEIYFAECCEKNLEQLTKDMQRFMDQENLEEENVALFLARSIPLKRILMNSFILEYDVLPKIQRFCKAVKRIYTTSSTDEKIENRNIYPFLSDDRFNQELQRLHDQYPVLLYAREHLVSRSKDDDVSFAKHCGENLEQLIEDIQRFMDQENLKKQDAALFLARTAPLKRIMDNPFILKYVKNS